MTWLELLWYFCDYIEERDLRMRGIGGAKEIKK